MKRLTWLIAMVVFAFFLVNTAHAWEWGHRGLPTDNTVLDDTAVPQVRYQPDDTVRLNNGGLGDLHILPLFVAAGEFATKISVVNTNQRASTVAKVVFRGHEFSEEIFNFYLYLSPADMWTGYIYMDPATGTVRVWSNDESMQSPSGLEWISEARPFDMAVVDTDDNWMGYVNIFNVAVSDARYVDAAPWNYEGYPSVVPGSYNLQRPGVDKQHIHDWFWDDNMNPALVGDQFFRQWTALDRNIIACWQEMTYGNVAPPFDQLPVASAALRSTALENFDATVRPRKRADMQIRTASLRTNLAEVEAELAKGAVIMPYVNEGFKQSAHIFTMPTKYSLEGPVVGGDRRPASLVFQQNAIGNPRQVMPYYPWIYDTKETNLDFTVSPFDFALVDELEFIMTTDLNEWFLGDLFSKGWIGYEFINRNGANLITNALTARGAAGVLPARVGDVLVINGLPVLPVALQFDGYGFSLSYGANTPTAEIYVGPLGGGLYPTGNVLGQEGVWEDGLGNRPNLGYNPGTGNVTVDGYDTYPGDPGRYTTR